MQLEVDGHVTEQDLENLKSQTEYDVAVTPIYDSGTGNPMLNQAITGEWLIMYSGFYSAILRLKRISSKKNKCQITFFTMKHCRSL